VADLSVSVESDLNKVLLGLAQQGKSAGNLLPAIAEMLVGAVHDVVEAEGPGWPGLADSTKRQRRGSTYAMLQDTGVFMSSVAGQYGSTYAEAVDGTSYGHFHVTGTKRMPKRDWTDLGPFQAPLLDDVAAMLTGTF
jgi:phage gpG-like protein